MQRVFVAAAKADPETVAKVDTLMAILPANQQQAAQALAAQREVLDTTLAQTRTEITRLADLASGVQNVRQVADVIHQELADRITALRDDLTRLQGRLDQLAQHTERAVAAADRAEQATAEAGQRADTASTAASTAQQAATAAQRTTDSTLNTLATLSTRLDALARQRVHVRAQAVEVPKLALNAIVDRPVVWAEPMPVGSYDVRPPVVDPSLVGKVVAAIKPGSITPRGCTVTFKATAAISGGTATIIAATLA